MFRRIRNNYQGGIICLTVIVVMFGGIGIKMGAAPMLNTIMNTAHDLLLNTVFYLMGICVITGALGKIFVEFGVVDLLEKNPTFKRDQQVKNVFKELQKAPAKPSAPKPVSPLAKKKGGSRAATISFDV